MCLQEVTPRTLPEGGRALTHLEEVVRGQAKLLSQGRPGDPNHRSERWAPGKGVWRPVHKSARPHPLLLLLAPTSSPLLPSCHQAQSLVSIHPPLPLFPSLLLPQGPRRLHVGSSPPQNPLPRVGAATHTLRGVWGPGPPAFAGGTMVPRSSGPRSCLLREEVGAGESTAGVRDRHGHRD